jgi:hypothetical protein
VVTRKWRVFILLFAALALAACGSVSRLAYLNAPPLATWYIGSYVDLTDAQKKFVKERLKQAMAWHREAELPHYQRAIEELIGKSNGKLSVEDARAIYGQARDYYHRSLDRLMPDIAEFLLTLDEEQIAQAERKLASDSRKLLRESVDGTPDERRAKRAKRFVEQFEEWTGHLTIPQREIIVSGTRSLPDTTEDRLADRKYRQAEVVQLLRARAPRDEIAAKLRKLFIDTDSWRRPEYLKRLRERDERLFAITSELSSTLSPEQRANVQRKMRGYVQDISSIIAAGHDGRG